MFRLLCTFALLQGSLGTEHPSSCCASGSALTRRNSTYSCVKLAQIPRVQIVHRKENLSSEDYCTNVENDDDSVVLYRVVDNDFVQEKVLDIEHFPKCCPLDYFYDTSTHACVKSSRKLDVFFDNDFVKIGLPHCKIIEDLSMSHIMSRADFRNATKPDNYCVDMDERGSYVTRVCTEDYSICNALRCVHKCCPDGQSFINGGKCYNTFVNGLDFTSLADNIEQTNGKYR